MPSRSEKRSVVPTPNDAADTATATPRRILTLPPLLPIPEVIVLRTVSLKHVVSQRSARRVTDIRRARKRTRARVIAVNIIGNSKSWGLWHGAGYLLACLDNVSGLFFFLAMGAIYRNRRMREVAALFSFQSYWGVTKMMEFVAVLSLEKRFY